MPDDSQLHIAHFMFALEPSLAGVASAVPELASKLEKNGIKNTIFSFGNETRLTNQRNFLANQIIESGSTLFFDSKGISKKYALGSIPNALRMIRMKINANLVIVHQVYSFATFWGWIYARKNNLPLILMPHGTFTLYHERDSRFRKIVAKILLKKILKDVTLAIATSESERNEIYNISKIQTVCLPYGIDKRAEKRKDFVVTETLNILYAGRFAAKKNLESIIRALPKVLEIYPKSILRLAGFRNKDEMLTLRNLAEQLHIEGKILFFPWQTQNQLWKLYEESHIFVLPSENENFGLVVGDALSFGVPCVISDSVSFSNIFDSYNAGVILRRKSPEAIAIGILKCVDEEYKDRVSGCLRLIEENFSWEHVSDLYVRELAKFVGCGFAKKAFAYPDGELI